MKTATGSAALRQPTSSESAPSSTEIAELISVRAAVVDNAGHVLGNLFQRLYHLADRTRENDTVIAAELESSTARLEEFLKLFLDYVSPARLCLQSVSGVEIAQSLQRQLADSAGVAARVDGTVDDIALLVDPGCLARSFALIAAHLRSAGRGQTAQVELQVREAEGTLLLLVGVKQVQLPRRSAEAEMQWAVAERFIEIQGGTLKEKSNSAGEIAWEVTLPLQA